MLLFYRSESSIFLHLEWYAASSGLGRNTGITFGWESHRWKRIPWGYWVCQNESVFLTKNILRIYFLLMLDVRLAVCIKCTAIWWQSCYLHWSRLLFWKILFLGINLWVVLSRKFVVRSDKALSLDETSNAVYGQVQSFISSNLSLYSHYTIMIFMVLITVLIWIELITEAELCNNLICSGCLGPCGRCCYLYLATICYLQIHIFSIIER